MVVNSTLKNNKRYSAIPPPRDRFSEVAILINNPGIEKHYFRTIDGWYFRFGRRAINTY